MSEGRRIAIVPISAELLMEMLLMPANTRLMDCEMSFTRNGTVQFKVEHESLEPVAPGYSIPVRALVFTRTPSGITSEFE